MVTPRKWLNVMITDWLTDWLTDSHTPNQEMLSHLKLLHDMVFNSPYYKSLPNLPVDLNVLCNYEEGNVKSSFWIFLGKVDLKCIFLLDSWFFQRWIMGPCLTEMTEEKLGFAHIYTFLKKYTFSSIPRTVIG